MTSLLRHTIVIVLFEKSQSVSVPFSLKYVQIYWFPFDFRGKSLQLLKNTLKNQMSDHDFTYPKHKLILQLRRAYDFHMFWMNNKKATVRVVESTAQAARPPKCPAQGTHSHIY